MEMVIHLAGLVRGVSPDLILLDLSMPVLSGINVAALIRRFQPHPIPIIVYSSRPQVELRMAAAELGAVAYLKKGGSDDELLNAVAEAIGGPSDAA
jgi:CheY-like chemotaxis protein